MLNDKMRLGHTEMPQCCGLHNISEGAVPIKSWLTHQAFSNICSEAAGMLHYPACPS